MAIKADIDHAVVSAGISDIEGAMKATLKGMKSSLVQLAAREAVRQIVERTRGRGQGVNDRALSAGDGAPYSVAYANAVKHRRAPVDLTLSGAMLDNLRARRVKPGEWVVDFPSSKQSKKAERHNLGLKGMPRRRFFGISKTDSRNIGRKLKPEATRVIVKNASGAYIVEGQGFVGSPEDLLVVDNR